MGCYVSSSLSQDSRKKREEERQKQLRWREEHRNALLQGHDSVETGESSSGRVIREQLTGSGHYGGQLFRQKQWHRGEKSAVRHLGDSMETDSNYAPSTGKCHEIPKDIRKLSKDISEMDTLPMGTTLSGLKSSPSITSPIVAKPSPPVPLPPTHAFTLRRSMTPSSMQDLSERRMMSDKPVHLIDFGEGDHGEKLSRFSSSGSSSPPNISESASALARHRRFTASPPHQSPVTMSPIPPVDSVGRFQSHLTSDSRPQSHPSIMTSPEQSRESLLALETKDCGVQVGEPLEMMAPPHHRHQTVVAQPERTDGSGPLQRRSPRHEDEGDEEDIDREVELHVPEMKSTSV